MRNMYETLLFRSDSMQHFSTAFRKEPPQIFSFPADKVSVANAMLSGPSIRPSTFLIK